MTEKIDFVILWVDGNDTKWKMEKEKYDKNKKDDSNGENRFRDWDNLKYWFRGVEKFANWVNKIFFITYGHVPEWLNVENEKIKVVKHEDFIPKEYLPTFNSNTIELNLHRIKELSEHFVLFNDDMFLINYTSPEDFFKNGYPKDECVQNVITSYGNKEQISHAMLNNIDIINRNFSKRIVMKKYFNKFINWRYGLLNFRTIFLLPWYAFTGFYNQHIQISHLKSTFYDVWDKEYDALNNSCMNKFRELTDVTHWVVRYWNICNGKFEPRNCNFGKHFEIGEKNDRMYSWILKQKSKSICINDSSTGYDFDKIKNEINLSLDKILDKKSCFEK